jgi:predicted ester cyclase
VNLERASLVSEMNKDIIRRYQQAYNDNDLSVLDEVLDPEWTCNCWPEGIPRNIEGAKQLYQMVLQSFPDTHYETLDLIAEGDNVVQRWRMRATFKGEILGLQPTGRVVEAAGVSIFRIVGGKIVDHCAFGDDLGFWSQLGAELPESVLAFPHRS